ncbi:hypothetical protein BG015_003477 [Linnemannia schmuckeri]|uniref:Ammonium transporter AmtB-like domain-containing protein n=1 Tax=Linnemannia schmuckeri TaxID=64567 RepID=A0A9P5S2E9_9FUNG|nr:hypothetical protein BG015_003477 [Linnemannia schmuckeri]
MNATETPAPVIGSQYEAGDIAWTLASTALVWLMIPGIGYFYSGMARSKNALSLIMLSCCSIAVVTFQWFLFGYSLAFSKSANAFIGNFDNAFFRGVLDAPSVGSSRIPDVVFMLYQGMFAALTPALAIGAAAERGRILPTLVFIFLWTTFVYDFIACWTWNPAGWSFVMGITWVLLDYRHERKLSVLGFCSGAVSGLVAITPGSGFVSPASSVAIGFLGACACNLAVRLKHHLKYDDAFDVFAVHGVGGIVGNLLTGVFAQSWVAALDGATVIAGGWLDGHWMQVVHQLADSAAGLGWSFTVTYLILFIMNKIPGLNIRAKAINEHRGLDLAELGEMAYGYVNEKAATVEGVDHSMEVGQAGASGASQSSDSVNEIKIGSVSTLGRHPSEVGPGH